MRVFRVISLCAVLLGCATPPEFKMAEQVGAWRRTEPPKSQNLPVPGWEVSFGNGSLKYRTTHRFLYSGPSNIWLTVYEFESETSAFEAFQKLQIPAGTMPFYKGRFLLIPAGDDRQQLEAFARELQKALP